MSPLAVAVVGTGFVGPVHVEALRRIGVRVKGIFGSSAEKSQSAARRLGLDHGDADYAALLADREVTAVHLTSPSTADHGASHRRGAWVSLSKFSRTP